MVQNITDAQKAKFLSLFDKGIGLVVLHHALVSYQHWPEYERIIGGRYPEAEGKSGVVTPAVGYEHDVDIPVVIAAQDHPVASGLSNFVIHDEIYWGFRVGPDITPLLTTSHAKSSKPLAWARTEKKSRVVFIQLGHGPEAFALFDIRDSDFFRHSTFVIRIWELRFMESPFSFLRMRWHMNTPLTPPRRGTDSMRTNAPLLGAVGVWFGSWSRSRGWRVAPCTGIRRFWQKPDDDNDQPGHHESENAPKRPATHPAEGLTLSPPRLLQHFFGA